MRKSGQPDKTKTQPGQKPHKKNGGIARKGDDTPRKDASPPLQPSQKNHHDFYPEDSPVPQWEIDLSGPLSFIDTLRRRGIADLDAYLG